MECERVRTFLPAFSDDELDLINNLEVVRHLESCPLCQAELALDGAVKRALKEVDEGIEPPEHLWPKVQKAIRREAGLDRGMRRWKLARYAAIAAAAVVVLVSFVVLKVQPVSGEKLAQDLADDFVVVHKKSMAEEESLSPAPQPDSPFYADLRAMQQRWSAAGFDVQFLGAERANLEDLRSVRFTFRVASADETTLFSVYRLDSTDTLQTELLEPLGWEHPAYAFETADCSVILWTHEGQTRATVTGLEHRRLASLLTYSLLSD